MSVVATKSATRSGVKNRLKELDEVDLESKSAAIVTRLLSLQSFIDARVVCCYLSMPSGEVRTNAIIEACFASGKRLFVPKVVGKSAADMKTTEVASLAQIDDFPKSSWGIPEPPLDFVAQSTDGAVAGVIDLVLVPGVAFDDSCGRIGHGKGYYDCFLERLLLGNAQAGGPVPVLVGLAFDEQMVSQESILKEPHDKLLDYVVTPSAIYRSSSAADVIVASREDP